MHLRPAKYTALALGELSDIDGVGVRAGSGGATIIRRSSPVLLIDSNNNNHHHHHHHHNNNNYYYYQRQFTANELFYSAPPLANGVLNALNKGSQYPSTTSDLGDGDSGSSSSGSGSKRFLTLESLPINYNNSNNNNMNFSKHDKIKLMELSIINLVGLSTLAAKEGKLELALERAKEALEGFKSLKGIMMQDRRSSSSFSPPFYHNNDDNNNININSVDNNEHLQDNDKSTKAQSSQPMTTGASLFELAIMVNSNLAAQFRNNGHLDESIKLYTQLCKMAGSASGTVSSSQQYEARFLLYRFGLNIGNIFYEMNEYQRALKYYRLTLDRLSSSGYKNLKMKLMNNISLALMAMKHDSDSITSLNLLLDDNLSQVTRAGTAGLISTTTPAATATVAGVVGGGAVATTTINEMSNMRLDVCNSNHHKFGLNLIVCHYQRGDLTSMMGTLKGLVKVNICHQYERVFNLDHHHDYDLNSSQRRMNDSANNNNNQASSGNEGRCSSSSTVSTGRTDTGSASHAFEQRNRQLRRSDTTATTNRAETQTGQQSAQLIRVDKLTRQTSVSSLGATQSSRQITTNKERWDISSHGGIDFDNDDDISMVASGSGGEQSVLPMDIDSFDGSSLLTTTTSGIGTAGSSDLAESADGRQRLPNQQAVEPPAVEQQQQHNSTRLTKLSAAVKSGQVMSAIQEDRLEILIGGKRSEITRSLVLACNLMLDLESRSRRQMSTTNVQGNGTSVFDFCLKLLSTSDTYKGLVCDLKTNSVARMLKKKYELDEAIAVLKGIELEQQAVGGGGGSSSRASIIARSPPIVKNHHQPTTTTTTVNTITTTAVSKSSMVVANSSLLYLLQRQTKKAIEHAEKSLKLDKFNVHTWINLANCHYQSNNFKLAETLYQRALSIDPSCWEANYNLALAGRKLGRHYIELKSSTKSSLAKDRQCFSSLLCGKMILSVIQLALIYQQSGKHQQAIAILNDLITNSKQAPEVHLLASRLADESSVESVKPSASAMTILQQANREHPYHIPVAERLIALNINNFNYGIAKVLLANCIKNRPDQVKWYQMLAECHRRSAEYDKAISTYKSAIETFPQDTSSLKALIKLTNELGLIEVRNSYQTKLDRALSRIDLQEGSDKLAGLR